MFSKRGIDGYRKAFCITKNYKHLSESEIEKANKSLNSLKKVFKSSKKSTSHQILNKRLMFKKFRGNIDSVDYEDLDNYDDNYDFINDDKYRKNGSIRTFFKEFDRDYYKSIRIDFARKKIITSNILVKEIDIKIYHLKNI